MAILVVGAGPVGLTLASELARHGVKPRVIERLASRSDKSRALVLWPRSLELLHKAGCVESFLHAGIPLHGMSIFNEHKARLVHISMDELRSPYNYVLGLPQNRTEELLEAHLNSLGVEVEREVELLALAQDPEQVSVTLGHRDGRREQLSVPWVAACDGAHSACRHALNVSLEGKTVPEEFAMVDAELTGYDGTDEVRGFFHSDGVLAIFPLQPPRYRVMASRPQPSPEPQPPAPTLEEMQAHMQRRGLTEVTLQHPYWLAAFRINERHATSYRHGRVFLLGDAAHVHSPVGGQGMNTGMQDAFNLGWKMALVLTGRAAAEPLLTSYSAERAPVGAAVVEGTGTARRVITLRHPVAQEVRNRLMSFVSGFEVVQQRLREQATELAIKYPKSPLNRDVHQGHAAWLLGRGIHPGDRAPDGDLVSPAGTASRLFELMTGTAFPLLLLAGQHEARPDFLLDVAQWVQRTYPGLVMPHWIDIRQRAGVWEHSFWLDPEGAVHRLYGASEPSLYLIRPDGYVGLRCQPAARAVLDEYLLSLGLQAPAAALS